jgi:hypothetical protein
MKPTFAHHVAVFAGQRCQVEAADAVRQKHIFAIVPAVSDMAPATRDDDARNAWRAQQITTT